MTVELSPLPDDLSEHFFDAGDVTLRYAIGRENGPPMVLIHGLEVMERFVRERAPDAARTQA